jgi:hypothetical protein
MPTKGQSNIMEYLILTIFIMFIIIVLVFFLSGWQYSQFRSREYRDETQRVVLLMDYFTNSPYFIKEKSMFDDSKLWAIMDTDDSCEYLEEIFGQNWFAEIEVIDESGIRKECDPDSPSTYLDCNYWSFCLSSDPDEKFMSYVIPVNVYRKYYQSTEHPEMKERTDVGTLKVGVYYARTS